MIQLKLGIRSNWDMLKKNECSGSDLSPQHEDIFRLIIPRIFGNDHLSGRVAPIKLSPAINAKAISLEIDSRPPLRHTLLFPRAMDRAGLLVAQVRWHISSSGVPKSSAGPIALLLVQAVSLVSQR